MVTSIADAICDADAINPIIHGMDVHEIRRENLRALIKRFGSQANLAERLGITPAYISQILSGHENRRMGERFARAIERALRLVPGALDHSHMISAVTSDDLAALEHMILEVLKEARADGFATPDELLTKYIVAGYRHYLRTGELPNLAQALQLFVLMNGPESD